MSEYDELIENLRNCAEVNSLSRYKRDLMRQAAGAIKKLQAHIDGWIEHERKALLKSVPKWIPVTERLPEDKQTCLIWYEYYHCSLKMVLPEYGIGFYLSMCDMWYGDPSTGKDVKVLYWMPLPAPPKEDAE